ncbi:MAG: serine protease [Alphaproteobacteria bacterium]|nr:serine protease [Alphaproteobacteria bacterium]
MKRLLLPFIIAFGLAGCSSRPPWSEGRMIQERRPQLPTAQDLSRFEERVLAMHDRERATTGAAPLSWDAGLAAAAAAYGPVLAAKPKLAHSEPGSRPGQGENLWMGTKGAFSLEEMVGSWIEEKRLFAPGRFPEEVSTSGHWSDVAHYTQMIWRGTNRVGCSLYSSRQWDYLVCRYAPPGNVVGASVP